MKLATILPVEYINLEANNDYHMALAHLVARRFDYDNFFAWHANRGDHVIMDNGVVEGERKSAPQLIAAAERINATEVILPDEIGDTERTLEMGRVAIPQLAGHGLMAVPQGELAIKWSECLYEMLQWPVDTIGITKFLYQTTGLSREKAVYRWGREILDAGKQIHLLGSPSGADEFGIIQDICPLVRGADSGYPAICAASGAKVRRDGRRPDSMEVDWIDGSKIDCELMTSNYRTWRWWVVGE